MSGPCPAIEVTALGATGAELIAALHVESFPTGTGERWRAEDIGMTLTMPGALGLVASRGDGPVGHALARVIGDECELLAIGVIPAARREGVARTLLAHLVGFCRSRKVKSLFIEVREDNRPARRLYDREGFRPVGLRRDYYRAVNGIFRNAITMKREISQDDAVEI